MTTRVLRCTTSPCSASLRRTPPFGRVGIVVAGFVLGGGPLLGQEDGAIVARDTVRFDAELAGAMRELAGVDMSRILLQRITYMSGGLRIRGYLAEPREPGDSLPAIIVNRGGNADFGALTDRSAAFLLGMFAQEGYVAVGSQYGGVAGGEGRDEFGGRDVEDVLNLIPLLDGYPRVDPERLGMFGPSRGGMMTYLALTRTDRLRAAAVAGAPARLLDEQRPEMEQVFAARIPEWETDREAAIHARSPAEWPERLHPETPILIVHGTADWRVQPSESLEMARLLLEARRPYRLVMFEGADHGISEFPDEFTELLVDWFDRYVRDGHPLPNLEPHGR